MEAILRLLGVILIVCWSATAGAAPQRTVQPPALREPLPTYHTSKLVIEPVDGEPWRFVTWSFDDCGGRATLDDLAAHGWTLVATAAAQDPFVGQMPVGVFEVAGPACLIGNVKP